MASTIKTDIKADLEIIGTVKTDAQVKAAIDKLGIGATDATINRRFAVLVYQHGKLTTGNHAPAADAFLKEFNARFRGGKTGRNVVKEDSSTFKTMASYYGAFAELGFHKAWPTEATFEWIMDNVKGPYTGRSAFVRSLISGDNALDHEPTAVELQTLWEASQKAPKLDGRAAALAKAIKALPSEPAFKATLTAEGPVRMALAKLNKAAADFEAAVKAQTGDGSTDDPWAEIMKDAA
jgi:hypothetical protein